MATNIVAAQARDFADIAPTLGGGLATVGALRENAVALLDHISTSSDLGPEEYKNQLADYKQMLKDIIASANKVAGHFAQINNMWNTTSASKDTNSSDFVLVDDDDVKSSSVQNLLVAFNNAHHLSDLSNTINAAPLRKQNTDPDTVKDLKAKLRTATEKTLAAEQHFKAKTREFQGQSDSVIKAAEAQSQMALLEQITVYNELMSIKLNNSISTTITFTWPDIGKWVKGATTAVGVATKIVGAIAAIL